VASTVFKARHDELRKEM